MKAYLVRITKSAERDLNRAADYIEFSLKNPSAADSLIDEAEKAVSSLSHMPERCPRPRDLALAAKGYRCLLVEKYLVFYVVAGDTVQIRRIIYGRRDYSSLL